MSGRSKAASPAKRLVKLSSGSAQPGRLEGRDLLHVSEEPRRVAWMRRQVYRGIAQEGSAPRTEMCDVALRGIWTKAPVHQTKCGK